MKHLESYRASLGKDALQDCTEYAKAIPTAKPEIYPTAFDYINHSLTMAKKAVSEEELPAYKTWLGRHQGAMIALFEKMASEILWSDLCKATPDMLLQLIQEGWNWFKFASYSIEFTMEIPLGGVQPPKVVPIVLIPRYADKYKKEWSVKAKAVFDADEMSYFISDKRDFAQTHPVVEFKLTHPGQKLMRIDSFEDGGRGFYKPIHKFNSEDVVVDWSLPLF